MTRPALLKHFKGTANHAGHIWSQQALVPSISVPSLQDWGWISLRGEWRLSCTPLSEITKLRVELVKYARKKGYAQKSDNRERQSQTLFSITSSRLHEVSSHKVTEISSVGSSLVMMFRIHNENSELSVYIRFKENIKVKKTSRRNRSLSSFLKSSDSGSFTSGLAGDHLYHPYSTFLDNLR